jgi:hypothetical protein
MVRWSFPNHHVSKELHCAEDNHTGYHASRASPDARCPAPSALWLPPGITCSPPVCRRPPTDGDCRRVVLLPLQCVSHCSPLACQAVGLQRRRGRPVGRSRPHHRLDALEQTLADRLTQDLPPSVWVVSHALELCRLGARTPHQTWLGSVRVDGAALAP